MQKKATVKKKKEFVSSQKELSSSKQKDSSSKVIFGNPVLCAQFLRGYSQIPLLKDVEAEDIEDVSERYVRMFREERNSDVVKKVRIKNSETPFFLVSLIEHKSNVDYNVVMQILRYMVCIWEEYEKDMEKQHKGISKTKDFKYPMILPIVFYDGAAKWTASLNLKDRIDLSNVLQEYIPDYKCLLINPRDYSNRQLMERGDILSIIMMIDKIQEVSDFRDIQANIPDEYLKNVASNTSEELLDIAAQVIEAAVSKINVSQNEKDTLIGYVKEYKMGELFSHLKGYDVQATREDAKREGIQEERESGIEKLIHVAQNLQISREVICAQLMEQYDLTDEVANKKIEKYWN